MKSFIGIIRFYMDQIGLHGIRGLLVIMIYICTSLFFLYTAYFGPYVPIKQGSVLLLACVSTIFLTQPFLKKSNLAILIFDLLLVCLTIVVFGYVIIQWREVMFKAGLPGKHHYILGTMCIVLVVEATRRKIGNTLPILALIFLVYAVFGPYMPGIIKHRGLSYRTIISVIFMTDAGIFGTPVTAISNFVIVFILFGSLLYVSGTGDLFTSLAIGVFGRQRGGPAKAAVVGSALMGTISGSAVANVVGTGTFTIPLMKKTGYKPAVAGAVEAVASTGGQIMPPIMGAAAFIMADILGVPYWEIVKAALIPAVLYYVALYFMVDLEAVKTGLKGMPKNELPDVKKLLLQKGYMLLAIFALIYFMGVKMLSPQKSAFFTIVVVIVLAIFRKETRIGPKKFVSALIDCMKNSMEVGVVCACAGITIGLLLRSGLALALTNVLIGIAGNRLLVLMMLTMVASLILGMGLPTSACYIIIAILIAPAMIKMGVPPITAHLFAFYYGCLSSITPPVALAAYAGAALAKSDPWETGWIAVKLGLCGFIVPFMFVFGPALILLDTVPNIIFAFITASIGCYFLAVGLMGYQFTTVSRVFRPVYIIAALLMIHPEHLSDFIGLAIGVIMSVINYNYSKASKLKHISG